MDTQKDLALLLGGRAPLIVVETSDEKRTIDLLKASALASAVGEYRPLFRWTVTDGLQRLDIELEPQPHNSEPRDVLGHIRSTRMAGTYVLLDFHPYLEDPVHVRLLKDICLAFDECQRYVVLVGHALAIPDELAPFSARFDLSLPDVAEREAIVRRVADEWVTRNPGRKVRGDREALTLLVDNLAGLSSQDTERLAHNAIFDDGAISREDLPSVMQAKYALLNRDGGLSYEYDTADFSQLAGLSRLKAWLEQRRGAFVGDEAMRHLDPPKGVLLTGVQGCGKSLAAKATAGAFGVPLLRLDMGALYNKFYGESEKNVREALATASVMAPCVLWIDEIEKALATGMDQSGTSRRILGTLLTWMAERRSRVFLVATANDITALPPELVRKGRFDEIFFVDLPDESVRAEIFDVHLRARDIDGAAVDSAGLARASGG
ncbi:MAG: AAA family ATPase, partial [Pseudomonadota bacterium]